MEILIIDDDKGNNATLDRLLQPMIKQGLVKSAEFVTNLRDGFRFIAEKHPNIILLDLTLFPTENDPGSKPLETIGQIHILREHAAVIILTGQPEDSGYWEACINEGALGYIYKPYFFDTNQMRALCNILNSAHLIHKRLHPAPYDATKSR